MGWRGSSRFYITNMFPCIFPNIEIVFIEITDVKAGQSQANPRAWSVNLVTSYERMKTAVCKHVATLHGHLHQSHHLSHV